MRENARLEFDIKLGSADASSSTVVVSPDVSASFECEFDVYDDGISFQFV